MIALALTSFLVFFSVVHSLEVKVQNGTLSQQMNFTLNSAIRHIIIFKSQQSDNPYRIKAWSSSGDSVDPVLVEVELQQDFVSWTVPLVIYTTNNTQLLFKNTSRILCDKSFSEKIKEFTVTLSTSSLVDVDLSLEVAEDTGFYIKNDENYNISASASHPQYFFYRFTGNESGTIIIEINSDDDVCLTASIQKNHCPMFDSNRAISYRGGVHQTIQRKGGMRIDRRKFPDGFFLIFVAKVDDYLCNTRLGPFVEQVTNNGDKTTTMVNFSIRKGANETQYKFAAFVIFAIILCCSLIAVTIVCVCFYLEKSHYRPLVENNDDNIAADDQDELDAVNRIRALADLTQNDETNRTKSNNYFQYTLNMAIFYIIPVVQLVATYQKVVNSTGNSDLCYYNFRCANPVFLFVWDISDFNHVYSNIGYLMMGILFLGVVRHRQWYLPMGQTGIPLNYGIFYALGTALIAEGVLSACYHICPTQAHFQFYTSFMYVMAVLCMVKLYQNRHPDIIPSASSTFTVLALIIFLAMLGLIKNTHDIILGCMVGVCYLILCTYISLKIYYFGNVLRQFQFCNQGLTVFEVLRPQEKARFIVLLIANVLNYALLITVIIYYIEEKLDFGTLLLILLMVNAALYAVTYTAMKLIYRERIVPQAIIYAILSFICWVPAAYFFLQNATYWSLSPAQSRSWNQKCIFLDFYDRHDLWHLLSSLALFFTFMYLLCLDDDIIHIDRTAISLF